MATTTTNFGWDIPQSTDLVKDGATAIATLGQDIDTAFVDLKGGTTGQVLSKASGTDLDFTWVAQDDSNAIQNAIVDAKGDLIAATAADTPARLAVGTNGQVLTADSTASTGLKWATPASGTPTFVGCFVYGTANQTVSNATVTTIPFAAENFDSDGFHSTTTNNSRITIPSGKAGKYLVITRGTFSVSGTGFRQTRILKNGTAVQINMEPGNSTTDTQTNASYILDLAVGDYIELAVYQNTGGNLVVTASNDNETSLQVSFQGA
jgi:hypothetical protein